MREKSTTNDCEAGHADLDSMGKDDIISCEISGECKNVSSSLETAGGDLIISESSDTSNNVNND